MHRPDSIYDDRPEEQYQFPGRYLSRAKECEGDWVVYLEPRSVRNSKGYFAIACVEKIIPDPAIGNMYLAVIEAGTYLDFGNPVPFRDGDFVLEQGLLNAEGNMSGRAQAAVRPIAAADFERILERGLGKDDDILPRTDDTAQPGEEVFTELAALPYGDVRDRIPQTTNRAVRERNFRKAVLQAYGETCAITGIGLKNGGGRAEVQAAHIRPVAENGPDIVSNGIALTGTAHWMFDRGLVGLDADKDFRICISRQANDPDAIQALINKTGRLMLPAKQAEQPRREFVRWHWENCFKH